MSIKEVRLIELTGILTIITTCIICMSSPAQAAGGVEIQSVHAGKKQVSMVVTETGRNDPFQPIFGGVDEDTSIFLAPPPEVPGLDNDAIEVIKAKVTGIIYDKKNVNSSAILNIEGSDYLTRVGDKVNGYEVTEISRNDITVKLGNNVFKAGVGDVITDSNLYDVNKTQTPALETKFAGRKR